MARPTGAATRTYSERGTAYDIESLLNSILLPIPFQASHSAPERGQKKSVKVIQSVINRKGL